MVAAGQVWRDPSGRTFEVVSRRWEQSRGEWLAVCYCPRTGTYSQRSIRIMKQRCKLLEAQN